MRDWVRMGLSYDDFWRMSLRECDLILCETLAREKSDLLTKRVLNQELGHLVAFGYHDPKKMPDFTKKAQRNAAAPEMGEAEAGARLRSLFVSMSINSKKE